LISSRAARSEGQLLYVLPGVDIDKEDGASVQGKLERVAFAEFVDIVGDQRPSAARRLRNCLRAGAAISRAIK